MFFAGLPQPQVPALHDGERLFAIARDADYGEPERIVAAWRLSRTDAPDPLARSLAGVLREPTLWLGKEIVEILRLLDVELPFGVDAGGGLAVSPTDVETILAAGACPVLGEVVPLARLRALRSRLVEVPPWLIEPRHDHARVFWRYSRSAAPHELTVIDVDDGDVRPLIGGRAVRVHAHDGQILFGEGTDLVIVGEHEDAPLAVPLVGELWAAPVVYPGTPSLHLRCPSGELAVAGTNAGALPFGAVAVLRRAGVPVARVVALAPGALGVLALDPLGAVVVDAGAPSFGGDGWSIERDGGNAFVVRSPFFG